MICVNSLKYTAFALNLFQIENISLTNHSVNTLFSLLYKLFTINLPQMFAKLLKYCMLSYNWAQTYVTTWTVPLVYHIFTTIVSLIWDTMLFNTTSFPITCCVNSPVYTSFVTYLSLIHKSCVVKIRWPLIYHWLPLIYNLCTHHLHKLYTELT